MKKTLEEHAVFALKPVRDIMEAERSAYRAVQHERGEEESSSTRISDEVQVTLGKQVFHGFLRAAVSSVSCQQWLVTSLHGKSQSELGPTLTAEKRYKENMFTLLLMNAKASTVSSRFVQPCCRSLSRDH